MIVRDGRSVHKLDENLPHDAALRLRNRGHDVHTVLDEQLGGHPDEQVLDAARAEDRVLVTYDLDFANIRIYPPEDHTGIWILRPHSQSIESALTLLRTALPILDSEPTKRRLWIIEPERIRIRA